ncbi:uncharacterized protein EI90DRAFT_3117513 [Cantharellus anzutake]|uniref:uncharacterized protein n=1 Tax=Cantharellus anzutake TaxID=1750568 RepID=UPI0019086B0E|nr:uncharacterized protein EI90DRAFT_3117513 [Cantharellus anzutake]KAF8339729.1 hypothetical protein EI90DRAFT_3117513 [Cantharellus anzutake]
MALTTEEDRTISRLWKISRTVHELVRDRGYEVSQEELTQDIATFRAYAAPGGTIDRNRLNFFTNHQVTVDDRIFVFFADEKNVSVKLMRRFLSILEEKQIKRGIIIYPEKMTPSAKKVVTGISDYELEDFEESSLLVNITKHTLVPKHEILTPQEKKELLLKYRLKETQLPRIQLTDPVARYYGLRRGDVVKITRPSETAGRYASYRITF